ncbi:MULTISPECIES: glycosyltransferase [Microbacterium]|uniref:glycosyltransferase n=1 Tax=Microbacterium TaxID=33882 RepID=UPI002016A076|nr:glycosyltransferase [Microbacterium sp. 4NA327F11]MCK9913226.1 glycosyltransferase [Microbacteriaceae bacterium K1510]
MTDLVSVIIVNFRGADDTIRCVEELESVDWPREQLEIIVVENGSGDDSAQRLSSLGRRIKLIRSAKNLGFTGGSNLGASKARGEIIAFLNNDSRPDRGWIREAVKGFHTAGQVGAVASKVLSWDGTRVDFAGGQLTWFGMGYKGEESGDRESLLDGPRDLLYGTGAALFVRASVFEELGGFDERLFMFYDDVDLGWRLNLLGYRVRFAPDSVVFHKHHASMHRFGEHRETYLLERNALILLYKNLGEENLTKFLSGALSLAARRATVRSGFDPEIFDIADGDVPPDELVTDTSFNKSAIATLFGIDQFVDQMPSLKTERDRIQATRVVRDEMIIPLFGNANNGLHQDPRVQEGIRDIVEAIGIATPPGRVRVLVVTGDVIGARMAGPAIRAWTMSEHLALRNDVRLVSPAAPKRASGTFSVHRASSDSEMRTHEEWADVIVIQGYVMRQYASLAKTKKILVADIYDPLHLEQLEQARDTQFDRWNSQVLTATEVLNEQLARADFFICASEKQRLFWLGQLAAVGRVNAMTYESDNSLSDLIAVVPFGLSEDIPEQQYHAIKGTIPGIEPDDKVILWGGGIYDWFDTETLLRAIRKVADTHPSVRLFFMGVSHPNPDVPQMKVVGRTFELADQLGLTDRFVFFNRDWVALDERHNYLLDADAAVSTHYEHLETVFSFRTRILDYLWARLPMVTTRGDGFADLIDAGPLGITVPERDVDALAEAIVRVLFDDQFRARARANIEPVRQAFSWTRALEPLTQFCAAPLPAADRNGLRDGHLLSVSDPAADAIRARYRGVRKAARLARHYYNREGLRGVARRIRARLVR